MSVPGATIRVPPGDPGRLRLRGRTRSRRLGVSRVRSAVPVVLSAVLDGWWPPHPPPDSRWFPGTKELRRSRGRCRLLRSWLAGSHRPLIGVTGRVSVGPACWPQAGPNATLPQFIASPPAFIVPAVPLPAQFSRRGRGTRRADSREKWSRFPAARGAWCGVAHGVLQVTKAGARHPKPGDNPL
jgi:hypothetical protein